MPQGLTIQEGSLQRKRKRPLDNKAKEAEHPMIYRTTLSAKDDVDMMANVVDEWSARRRDSQLNIHDLSFILHPSHEATTPPGKDPVASSTIGAGNSPQPLLIPKACHALAMSPEDLELM